MRADRLHADIEIGGNLTWRFAGRNLQQNLEFAVGKLLVPAAAAILDEVHRDGCGQRGSDVLFAFHNRANALGQLFARAILCDVTGRAGFQQANGVRRFAIHAQNQNRKTRVRAAELQQQIEAVAVGEVEVEDDDVDYIFAKAIERLGSGARLGSDGDVIGLADDLAQTVAHDGVIVGDQHADHDAPACAAGTGIRTETVVPRPSTPSTSTLAPIRRARSRMPMIPRERWSRTFSAGMPLPSSRISSDATPSF